MNPYQTPRPTGYADPIDSADRIEVRGVVTVDDVTNLIGVSWLFRILQLVSGIAIGLFGLMIVGVIAMNPGDLRVVLTIVGIGLALTTALLLINWLLGRRWRAKRLVKRNPGIIGPIDAWIDSFGVGYRMEAPDDDVQFSWACFSDLHVSHSGITLSWKQGESCGIVFPAGCVHGFAAEPIRQVTKEMRKASENPAIAQAATDWSLLPGDAIRVEWWMPGKPPLTSAQRRRLMILNGLQMFGYGVCALLYFWSVSLVTVAILALLPTLVALVAQSDYRAAAPASYDIRIWGWLTREGICGHLPGNLWRSSWDDAIRLKLHRDSFTALFADDIGVVLDPSHLIDGDWETLVDWMKHLEKHESSPQFVTGP